MKIEFYIRDKKTCDIVKNLFNDIPDIIVNLKSITYASYQTIISAGNTFGEMNGGVDGMINAHLSGYIPDSYIQEHVKLIINEKIYGEFPLGQSINSNPTSQPIDILFIHPL